MIKKRSVFNYNYSRRYYLTHPWKLVKEFFRNCNHAWRRAIYGWTWEDCWNLEDWLLNLLPEMLRHMADNGSAYPGSKPFETPEKWHDWLHSMADVLESLQEENWYSQNEYEEEFHNQISMQCSRQNLNDGVTVTWSEEKDFDIVEELYLARVQELNKEREKLLIDTGRELFQYLDYIWD